MSRQSPSPPATPPSQDSFSSLSASKRHHRQAETISVSITSKGDDLRSPKTHSPNADLDGPQNVKKVQFEEPNPAAANPKDEKPTETPESTGGGPNHPTLASPEPRPPKAHQNNGKGAGIQNIDHADSDGQSSKMTMENIGEVDRGCNARGQLSENI
ncbi:hypothetical protein EV356DRAFT_530089 [Viridothelium virens]|uniref:Uncharacterized protein n=1 Tax=Viridothelium virens TaxID=1048519 RepID=A0A6A6HGW3_VIRVR|nr:hypothetical protein EV356DRAFT_530089 [Viridothelium virens]